MWLQVSEHARWLAEDYPQHRALRKLQLEALLALGRYADADLLCDQQLQVTPEAPELLEATARLTFIRSGVDAALAALSEVDLEDEAHVESAELYGRLQAMRHSEEEAKAAMLAADAAHAIDCSCRALALAEESVAARQAFALLLARALSRAGRHVEAIAASDRGLHLVGEARRAQVSRAPAATPNTQAAAAAAAAVEKAEARGSSTPSDHERLLLARARAFLSIGQPAQAIADYRSVTRSQAALKLTPAAHEHTAPRPDLS